MQLISIRETSWTQREFCICLCKNRMLERKRRGECRQQHTGKNKALEEKYTDSVHWGGHASGINQGPLFTGISGRVPPLHVRGYTFLSENTQRFSPFPHLRLQHCWCPIPPASPKSDPFSGPMPQAVKQGSMSYLFSKYKIKPAFFLRVLPSSFIYL